MAHITSREELEEWLKDKPADWAQVIAARAALRVFPHAFRDRVAQLMVRGLALDLIRANSISWAAQNISSHDMAYAYAAIQAAYQTYGDAESIDVAAGAAYTSAAYSVTASTTAAYQDYAAAAAGQAFVTAALTARETYLDLNGVADAARITFWDSVSHDCDWLARYADEIDAARRLTQEKLWPAGKPEGWRASWDFATTRLLSLDPSYQVWIDWYNRRIEGHDAAFDIPGDIDRVHDKAILARLADATDEDFWGKGATYVNTTLQGWIDDARIEARVEDILRKLRGGASAHYGTPEDLAGRAALLDELDRLLGKSPQARHGIGGNYPPEPIGAVEQSAALPQEMREPLEALSTELEKREPDALVVVEQVKLLHRVVRKLGKMADIAGDEFAKEFGGELGKGAAKLITRVPYLAVIYTLITMILDWLAPLIHISG